MTSSRKKVGIKIQLFWCSLQDIITVLLFDKNCTSFIIFVVFVIFAGSFNINYCKSQVLLNKETGNGIMG